MFLFIRIPNWPVLVRCVLLLILTFALTTPTCDGVRLANYVPTLQEYHAGCDDLIESYFHLGLEYSETVVICRDSGNICCNIQKFCCLFLHFFSLSAY